MLRLGGSPSSLWNSADTPSLWTPHLLLSSGQVRSWYLEKEMATNSSVLAWRIPGVGEPGGLPSLGSHRVGHDWSDLASIHTPDHQGCSYCWNQGHSLLSWAAWDHQQEALFLAPCSRQAKPREPVLPGSSPNLLSQFWFLQWRLGGSIRTWWHLQSLDLFLLLYSQYLT